MSHALLRPNNASGKAASCKGFSIVKFGEDSFGLILFSSLPVSSFHLFLMKTLIMKYPIAIQLTLYKYRLAKVNLADPLLTYESDIYTHTFTHVHTSFFFAMLDRAQELTVSKYIKKIKTFLFTTSQSCQLNLINYLNIYLPSARGIFNQPWYLF